MLRQKFPAVDFMSLHYILDGYNISQQISFLALKELKSSREGLIKLIEIYKPQGKGENKVTIVFDGRSGIWSDNRSASVKVIFSEGESADDRSRKIVSDSSRKKEMIVVTDDKELRFSVRALGANVMQVKDFLLKIKKYETPAGAPPSGSKIKKRPQEETKYISKTLEAEINSELEKIWLKHD